MRRLLFDRVEQGAGQFGAYHLLVPALVAEKRPVGGAFERVCDHPVGRRMQPRLFRDGQQVRFADADFELELHEQAAMGPVATES